MIFIYEALALSLGHCPVRWLIVLCGTGLLINLLDTVSTSLRFFTIVGTGQSSMFVNVHEALARTMVDCFMRHWPSKSIVDLCGAGLIIGC